uniref:YqaJ viral recombinase domain-containing protein n=1 Tax=viral metagenome TaxID=1070528 RepID=A0A6C0BRF9_9ZZZZ
MMNLIKPLTDEELDKMNDEIELEEYEAEEYFKSIDEEMKIELFEFCFEMFNNLHLETIHLSCEENFDDFMVTNVTSMLRVHCDTVEPYSNKLSNLSDELKDIVFEYIVTYSEKMFYTHVTPRRSYDKTFIRFKPNIEKVKQKIEYIRSKPQPEQRTDAWYESRYNMITASSVGKIFETKSALNSIIYEKCKPFTLTNQTSAGALGWGIKYEPVSVMFYESYYKCKVEDFGCITHDKYSFLGASPDGIVVSEDSYRYGRMLEIKNPISRKITGNPKKMYWIQMQMQMEVCNMNECDFLETKFSEYANDEEFNNDGTFSSTTQGQLKGIILQFTIDENTVYEYLPLYSSETEYCIFKNEMLIKYGEENIVRTIYYKLDHYSCILVLRNKEWISYAIPKIEEVWNTIVKERVDGYDHRAPKERKKKTCMIDINDMNNSQDIITEMFCPDMNTSDDKISDMFPHDMITSQRASQKSIMKVRTESFDETSTKLNTTDEESTNANI